MQRKIRPLKKRKCSTWTWVKLLKALNKNYSLTISLRKSTKKDAMTKTREKPKYWTICSWAPLEMMISCSPFSRARRNRREGGRLSKKVCIHLKIWSISLRVNQWVQGNFSQGINHNHSCRLKRKTMMAREKIPWRLLTTMMNSRALQIWRKMKSMMNKI